MRVCVCACVCVRACVCVCVCLNALVAIQLPQETSSRRSGAAGRHDFSFFIFIFYMFSCLANSCSIVFRRTHFRTSDVASGTGTVTDPECEAAALRS